MSQHNQNISTVILAAGNGSRLKSNLPKWAHKLGGVTTLEHCLQKAKALKSTKVTVVFSPSGLELGQKVVGNHVNCVVQKEPKGTADAALSAKNKAHLDKGVVLILYCDGPLISLEILQNAVDRVLTNKSDVCLIAFEETKPNSYGRIAQTDGNVSEIIETKGEDNHHLTLCNSGAMAVRADLAWDLLDKIDNKNKHKEYYLTDIVSVACKQGLNCGYVLEQNDLAQGFNTLAQLADLEKTFQHYKRLELMEQGVQLIMPETVYFSLDTSIGKGTVVYPHNVFLPGTTIKENVTIKSFCCIESSVICSNSQIGPFARLRGNTTINEEADVGNFVEMKNVDFGQQAKAKHLTYLGDTFVGKHVNIGAGVITCNSNGISKFRTTINDKSFIGSNSTLVAPLNIEQESFIAAGSVITKNVHKYSLAISRVTQVEVPDWVNRRKNKPLTK